ncbi:TetR/AcrR family transcriptional regulator [Lysinibacter cavernae]|uniref:AcrR family transcriptional regulator n=1 Tax=Lysinibacter cavernae TaxID=1640652 RepID=A0A7X5R0X1_9MICO|nr:TetR/AcrR family transcriptional regulator [Lysinibacter cavernae]NIH53584.1 AcrR family transcriptional regulator [Lysinibacter cavernae]
MAKKSPKREPNGAEEQLHDATRALAEAAAKLGSSLGGQISAEAEATVSKGLLSAAKALANATAWIGSRTATLSTREQLIRSAARLFSERGFNGVSLEDIAIAAGFTKGAVYSQFNSKEQLFLEATRYGLDALAEELARAAAGSSSGADAERGNAPAEIPLSLDQAYALAVEAILFGIRVPAWREQVITIVREYVRLLPRVANGATDAPGDVSESEQQVLPHELTAFSLGAMFALLQSLGLDEVDHTNSQG